MTLAKEKEGVVNLGLHHGSESPAGLPLNLRGTWACEECLSVLKVELPLEFPSPRVVSSVGKILSHVSLSHVSIHDKVSWGTF